MVKVKYSLPAAHSWWQNLPHEPLMIIYQQKSQNECLPHTFVLKNKFKQIQNAYLGEKAFHKYEKNYHLTCANLGKTFLLYEYMYIKYLCDFVLQCSIWSSRTLKYPLTKPNLQRLQPNDRAMIRQICNVRPQDIVTTRSSELLARH